ncbi:alpha/beta fold hydrolase [Streptomyces inhibens]|uniref:alpha/beta fold hydrolase n=1 Tax=Streptomyces inhibens TaxID=2293571 RepID=UPI001EE74E39|nr:alpha/beta hydrolase [Streptomyces inhibens]UKY47795.1 alpha/beta hydrolase [Streptomyces inhibens]
MNTTTRPARQAPLGHFYDINGRSLFLHRSGSGGPAVVFLPGASAIGLDYLNIHDRISQFTTSVLYDRGGTGWSDPADLPRTLAEVSVELRELLRAADVPAPYVLVAHSLGCAYARRFVQLFPEEAAGVVYLDGIVEDWETYMPQLRPQKVSGTAALRLVSLLSRGMYRRMFTSWPREIREPLVAHHLTMAAQRAGALERSNQPEWLDELKAGGPAPDTPLIALTAMGVDPGMRLLMSPKKLRQVYAGKRRLYDALAASVAHGEHRILSAARHSTITTDCPDAVTQAVRDLWQRVC